MAERGQSVRGIGARFGAAAVRAARTDGPAFAVLVVVVAAVLWGGWGELPRMRDMVGLTIPWRLFWRDVVLAGEFPAWNPYIGLGIPGLAGTLYPGNLLFLVGPFPLAFFITWALHMLFGGIGGHALARACGCRPATALVSGLVWCAGGYVVSMWWNGEKALSCAWLPWIALGVRGAVAAPRLFGPRLVVGALAAAMFVLVGDPFLLFDAALFALPFALDAASGRAERAESSLGRAILVALGGVAATFALALLFAAPALFPAFMLRGDTSRATAFTRAAAEAWSLHPVRWLELFTPNALGDPRAPETYAGAPYADDPYAQVLPWAVSLYAGAGTFALATAAPRRRLTTALWAVVAVAVLVALGRHTPLRALLVTALPPLRLTRYPEKHVVVACGALALLASIGLESIVRRDVRLERAAAAAAAGLAGAAILAPAPLRATVSHGALHALLAVAALAAAVVAARRDARFVLLAPLAVAVDLTLAARPLFGWIPRAALAPPPLVRELAPRAGAWPPRIFRPRAGGFEDVATLPDNAAGLFGIAAIPGHEPAIPPVEQRVVAALVATGARAFEVLRLDAALLPGPDDQSGWRAVRGPRRPRAWMVARAEARGDDAALLRMAETTFDPDAEAFVDPEDAREPDIARLADAPRGSLGACALVSFRATELVVRCDAPQPAFLVVAEGGARGWDATVDGAPRPIVRTNLVFRGVALPPGRHDVRFAYSMPWRFEGSLMGVLGALIGALAIARGARAGRNAPAA